MRDTASDVQELIEVIKAERAARDIHPVMLSTVVHLTAYRERLLDAEELATEIEKYVYSPHVPPMTPEAMALFGDHMKRLLLTVIAHLRASEIEENRSLDN